VLEAAEPILEPCELSHSVALVEPEAPKQRLQVGQCRRLMAGACGVVFR
jgi:hypothetical protein